MNLNQSYLSLNAICMGCLSTDRKLTSINYPEISTILLDIFNPSSATQAILLCWECMAVTNKVVKFKQRVKLASELLLKYAVNKANPPSLSNIKRSKTKVFASITKTNTKELKSINTTQNLNAEKQSCDDLEIGHRKVNANDSYNSFSQTESHDILKNGDEPSNFDDSNVYMFFKVENDGYDCIYNDDFNDDEKYLKNVLKQDTDVKYTEDQNSVTSKAVTDNEEFNESDEEPLNEKKKKKKVYRKKLKEDSVPNTVDCDGLSKVALVVEVDRIKTRKAKGEEKAGVVRHARVERVLQQLNVDPTHMEMVVLGWDEVEADRHRARQNVAFTRPKYKCYHCVIGFNHKFKLENHMKKHEECSGTVVCPTCMIWCRDAAALREHKRRHQVRWRCCICGELFSRAPVAADHVSRVHGAPSPIHLCKICGHRESTMGKLRSHLKNHGERQKCDMCGKTFRDRASLRTHTFIHNGEKEYSCPHCGKRFFFKQAMEVHMVTHNASAHLYCHECDMNFKNRLSYNQHMKYNLKHIDPSKLKYACKLCDKKFAKAQRLEEHHLAIHLNAKPISCTVQGCTFTCSSRPVLRTHLRMVHRNARAQRNHVCDTCGKAYTTKKILEGHMRSHSGERPFRCPLCPSTFGYEAALYNHNRLVHLKSKTGRTPTSCIQTRNEDGEKQNCIS